jgi:predicted nucleotidyltransferase
MVFTDVMPRVHFSFGPRLPQSQQQQVRSGLADLGVPSALIEALLPLLPESTSGILVYGSYARGDARAASDLDILVVGDDFIRPEGDDRISLSFYSEQQLRDATGTLFGYHLTRDGKVLLDVNGQLSPILAAIEPPDPDKLKAKIRRLSAVLTISPAERAQHLPGMTQVARYLLRSAMYAEALKIGEPCFSVQELAARDNDPSLRELLSSHAHEQRPPTEETFSELRERLERIVGSVPNSAAASTLEALIVEAWFVDQDLSNLALLALGTSDEGILYSEVPKVVL